MTYHAGDKPGAGAYRCLNCGYIVHVESDDQELPVCPNGGHEECEKVQED